MIGNILAEDNSGKLPSLSMRSLILHNLDSDQDEPKSFGNHGFATGFGVNASYGRAFNAIPDRVGSAPATEIGVVRFIVHSIILTLS